ncbi:transporter suffix domain-containing protein [Argonema antarcticum]|uniref:transporter suffix domain-containing protein n=1 Tax=Argonema antarcticum TaxID=2942763 RepID=UPI002012A1F9|nr:transporter suffix domain-containing protein [Argonema antarcticum]MCL1469709.1 transporter suffix domain-containing protein [Argonema antarcticum A004/B2]
MNLKNLGLSLIVASLLPWVAIIFVVPFLPLDLSQKAVLVPILAIIAEVFFWLGLVLAGKEVATKYRRYFSFGYIWKKLKRWRSRR